MLRAQRKNHMGKAQNNPTPNITEPVEDPYNGFSVEIAQDTDCRIKITDMLKEIIELRRENEKIRKDLEGDNENLQKEVETLKRSHAEMKMETNE